MYIILNALTVDGQVVIGAIFAGTGRPIEKENFAIIPGLVALAYVGEVDAGAAVAALLVLSLDQAHAPLVLVVGRRLAVEPFENCPSL